MCSTSTGRPARSGGTPTAPALRAGVAREDRTLGPEGAVLAAGLDLDEDERRPVAGDDVELAVAGAGVALEDLPAGGDESPGDQGLGFLSGCAAGGGHRRCSGVAG